MRRTFLLTLLVMLAVSAIAQQAASDFSFKFYGRIRGDLFYNSRANEESVDGLFYSYPKDKEPDAAGNDLNATPQSNFYTIYTRLGVNIGGPKLGSAATSANVELDFRGSGSTMAVVRLRQAYVNFDWGKSQVLVGQTWHPLFGEVSPSVLNLSTGSPFQPFNRSPMVRYRYSGGGGVTLTGAAIWQSQYNSDGPDGKSHKYLKNGMIPEIFAGVDYRHNSWLVGASAEMLSISPRQKAVVNGKTYKVSERVTSLSFEAHAKWYSKDWMVSGKTVLANNLTHCSMPGGFAVTSVDPVTGECDYTPFTHSMSWFNVVYGHKWQPGIFFGYLKNLGAGERITGTVYGSGANLDQVVNFSAQLSYNLANWKIGVEAMPCTAWYGTLDLADGRVRDTHSVTNWRFLAALIYTF